MSTRDKEREREKKKTSKKRSTKRTQKPMGITIEDTSITQESTRDLIESNNETRLQIEQYLKQCNEGLTSLETDAGSAVSRFQTVMNSSKKKDEEIMEQNGLMVGLLSEMSAALQNEKRAKEDMLKFIKAIMTSIDRINAILCANINNRIQSESEMSEIAGDDSDTDSDDNEKSEDDDGDPASEESSSTKDMRLQYEEDSEF